MEIKKVIATKNDCYQRNKSEIAKLQGNQDIRYARYYKGPKGVMIHSTGANNPNLKRYVQPDDGNIGVNPNCNDWNRPGLEVCVHAFVGKDKNGDVAAYQILPWEYRAWHCGGDANDTHLAFEICEDDLEDRDYFWSAYWAAVDLAAGLCHKFGLDPLAPGVVIDHAEGAALGIASNHADTGHWWSRFGVSMDDFRADVSDALEVITRPLYRVRRAWADKDSQIGAFADLAKAKAACPVGYSIFDPKGKAIYTNTGKDELEMQISKEELQEMINDAAAKAVLAQKDPVVYQSLERVPEYGKPTIAKLVDAGALKGTGQGLGLTTDMVRILTVLDRLGKLD